MVCCLQGMEHLHDSGIRTHGRLKSSNCLVDSRWSCKITDYGLFAMRMPLKEDKGRFSRVIDRITMFCIQNADKLWTAPELLRMLETPVQGTQPGDVYSFAMVMQEVILRDRPFCRENMDPQGE